MNIGLEIRQLYTQYKQAIFFAYFIAFACYAYSAVNLMLAGDDWNALVVHGFQYDWALSLGRWGTRVFWELSYDNTFMLPLSMTVFISCIIACSILILDLAKVTNNFLATLVIGLWVTNPIWIELVAFNMAHIAISFGLLSAALGVYLVAKYRADAHFFNLKIDLIAACLIAFSASCYQPAILLAGMIIVLDIYLSVIINETLTSWKALFYNILHWAIIVLVALLLYAITCWLILAFADIDLNSGGGYGVTSSVVQNFQQFLITYNRFCRYFYQFLFQQQLLWPFWTKILLWILIIVALFQSFFISTKSSNKTLLFTVSIISIILLLVLPFAIGLIRIPNSYRYNALLGLSAVMPILLVLQAKLYSNRYAKGFLIALCFAILTFIGSHNKASLTLNLINQADLSLTERIIGHLENNKGFARLISTKKRLTVIFSGRTKLVGRPFTFDNAPPPMNHSILGCGIYNCQLRRFSMAVKLLAGYPLPPIDIFELKQLNKKQKSKLQSTFKQMPQWPDPGSIQITDNAILIKLTNVK